MYVCTTWRIYSGGSACIAVFLKNEILNGIYTGIDTNTTIDEKDVLWSTTDTLVLIELQWHEKLSLWDLNLWNVTCLTPINVNWYLRWLLVTQTAGKTIRCYCGNLNLLKTSRKTEIILFWRKCHLTGKATITSVLLVRKCSQWRRGGSRILHEFADLQGTPRQDFAKFPPKKAGGSEKQ